MRYVPHHFIEEIGRGIYLLIIYFCLQPKLKTKMLQPHPAPEDRVVMSPRGSDPAPRIQGAAVDPDFMADRPQMQ